MDDWHGRAESLKPSLVHWLRSKRRLTTTTTSMNVLPGLEALSSAGGALITVGVAIRIAVEIAIGIAVGITIEGTLLMLVGHAPREDEYD